MEDPEYFSRDFLFRDGERKETGACTAMHPSKQSTVAQATKDDNETDEWYVWICLDRPSRRLLTRQVGTNVSPTLDVLVGAPWQEQ